MRLRRDSLNQDTVTPSAHEEVVERLLHAASTRDYDLQGACVGDTFVIDTPFAPTEFPSRTVGRDAFIEAMRSSDKMFEHKVLVLDEIYPLADPDTIIAEYHTNAMTKRGESFDQKYVGIFKLEAGKVAYWREYYDPDVIRRTFKLALKID